VIKDTSAELRHAADDMIERVSEQNIYIMGQAS
jgi:hypothetical protein